MSSAKENVSVFLPPILSIYFICLFLFALDSYLLGDIFPEYDRIEPEYRPVEQATRLGYLFVAAIAWKDLQANVKNKTNDELQTGKTLFFFGMILVILENNWDLTLRESMIGRFIFAATLGSVLVRLSWLAFHSDWAVPSIQPLLYISVLGILGLGQTVDAFHDGIVSNEAANDLGTNIILEETTELFAAWVLFHAAWLWHNRNPKMAAFWRQSEGLKLLAGLFFLGIGNGFLAFTREDSGGHFVSNQIAALGFFLIICGIYLIIKQVKNIRYSL